MDRKNAQTARGVGLLLASTALGAGLVFLPAGASLAGTPDTPSKIKTRTERRAHAKPAALDPAVAAALTWSIRQGKNGLLAGVFDATHQHPSQRDAVLAHARSLAPGLNRDLTTAADLGVLTAGQTLVLAPNAASAMQQRSAASASGIGASAYSQKVAMANNPSPNLPNPQPNPVDQTWHLDMIKASVAYGRNYTGAGVNVAVADTGFDLANAALAGKLITGQGRNYVLNNKTDTYDPTQVGLESPNDKHGTHVAGIIAATKFDNVAMHGVAYNATITPFRILAAGDDAPNAVVAPGIEPSGSALNAFANLAGTMVYNASYGPNIPDGAPPQKIWSFDTSDNSEYSGLLNALKAGKLVVAANGNDRQGHPDAAKNPSGLALMPFVQPGNLGAAAYTDGGANLDYSALQQQEGMVIAVMAVAKSKTAATYSNLCGVTASWCVAAPGGDTPADRGIYSTFPGNTYGFLDGTSMATPTVSGAIAVLIQAYSQYNARDLARLLFSTTEDLGLPGLDAVYGYGLIRLDRATDGPTTLAPGHVETVAANTTTYWSQPLMAGAFTKSGDGVLTIAGRTYASGAVGVTQGTLAVDGTLDVSTNQLTVNAGSVLAGIGVVNGNTAISGLLSPGKMPNVTDLLANGSITNVSQAIGNSAGTLTFNGNVTLAANSATLIDIDGSNKTPGGPGTFDKIVVTGVGNVFTANGTLVPVLRGTVGTASNYTPPVGAHFDFVQAVDGAQTTGTFATLVQPDSGMAANTRLDLIYAPSAITLHVTPVSFANMASSTNPTDNAISAILDRNRTAAGNTPTAQSKPLYDALYGLNSAADYGTAIRQLGAPGAPAVTSAPMLGMQGFMGSVSDRQDALSGGTGNVQAATSQSVSFAYASRTMSAEASRAEAAFASLNPVTPSSEGWGVWGQGFGRWSNVGDNGGLLGSTSRSGGFTVGADRLLAPDLIGGLAFGFARTTSTATGTRSTADSYTGALYATWTPGAAVFDLRAAAGPSRIQTSRDLILTPAPVTGNASGFGGGVSVEAGYRIPVGIATLKPFAGLAWQGFRRDGYTETQQPFGLTFPSQYFEKITTTLGIAASTQTRFENGFTLMPEIKLGWGHDWRDSTLVTQAALLDQPFSVNGAQPGRDAALVGVKFAGWMHQNFRLFVAYNGEFRSNAASHQLSGGARYTW
ncbi:MAG: autotransporter domain-containing protein [Rhizobiales bacterium]|nr:autotransporter domain-containing protein [Hyphomicrobiales bacterium]